MPSADFLENNQILVVLVPVADAFAGGATTDYVNIENYRTVTFIVTTGAVEDANISNLVTLNASDDASGSNTTAMAFRYRDGCIALTDNTWGDLTAATATGYNFATNNTDANNVWYVTATADEVEAAQAGAKFVSLTIAETANKTITAAVICILSDARYPQATPVQAIA